MKAQQDSVGDQESVLPSLYLKEQYLMEYFELIGLFRQCNLLRIRGYPVEKIEQMKAFRQLLAYIVSVGEKIRRKMERKDGKKKDDKPYTVFLGLLGSMYHGDKLSYRDAFYCTKKISDFFEDSGYTNLDLPQVSPGKSVDEWE